MYFVVLAGEIVTGETRLAKFLLSSINAIFASRAER